MRKIRFILSLIVIGISVCFVQVKAADIPPLVQYTGLLTDSNGNPLPDGSYKAVFNLYTQPSGSTAIWTESWDFSDAAHPKIATQNGRFTVLLGNNTEGGLPLSVFQENKTVYLGITVEDDPQEMLPRQRISSVPFALVAGDGVPRGGVIMWSGSLGAIPQGWALCDGQNGTPDLRNRFIVGAGDAYSVEATGGVASVNLRHSHSINGHGTTSSGAHQHSVTGTTTGAPTGFNTHPRNRKNSDENYMGHQHNVSATAWGNGAGINSAHSHSINALNSNFGLSSSQENRPPYYALAYIMKL